MRLLPVLALGFLLPGLPAKDPGRTRSGFTLRLRLPVVSLRIGHRRPAGPHVHRGCACHPPLVVQARGRWRIVRERVWVPAIFRRVRDRWGKYRRVCLRPGRYEWRERRIWVRA